MTLRMLIRQLKPALLAVVALTLICGVAYPLISTLIGRTAFREQTGGSLIRRDGVVVGSKLLGQPFAAPQYFHPRPSAAGQGYDGSASSGSNLGPLNADLLDAVRHRVADYRAENGLAVTVLVPVDAVTASGSGLDPHISLANARLQAPRVANARGMDLATVDRLIAENTQDRVLGVLGEPGVNVLELNVALDQLAS